MKRASGVLLPVFSLPSKYGIGCFSKEAYKFIDQLKEAGQSYWQILPLGPTGYGDSPYQSFSTYAGNPYFIDLKTLIKEGLLTKKECKVYDFGEQAGSIDYEKIYNSRFKVLKKAFERFEKDEAYDNFIKENAYWLDDYSLYMTIKDSKGGISWNEWEEALKNREEAALENAREELAEEIDFYKFQQYEFDKQWSQLHAYANEQGIQIVGDIPIYVARLCHFHRHGFKGIFRSHIVGHQNRLRLQMGCPGHRHHSMNQPIICPYHNNHTHSLLLFILIYLITIPLHRPLLPAGQNH